MQFSKYQNARNLLNLSEGWILLRFEELLRDVTKTGTKIPSANYEEQGLYPVVDQGKNLIAGYSNLENPIEGTKIIFGDHTRILKYIEFDGFHIGADGVKVLENKVPDKVVTKFIYYYLASIDIPNTGYNRHFKYLKEIVIPIPPIELQKKIVDVFDGVKELINKRRSQIAALDELTHSLFLEMFGDSEKNPKIKIGDVVQSIEAGWSVSGEERLKTEDEIAVLKISAVTKGYFKDDQYKVINPETQIKKVVYPQKGDVLFSRANTRELVGASAIVLKDYQDLILPDKLWKINLRKELVTQEYFHTVINTKEVRNEFSKNATGTSGSMLNISMQKFKEVEINLPTIDEQILFSEKVKKIQKTKASLNIGKEKLENLYNALLQKAFKGELL